MARPHQFNKKENEKKKLQKRVEKAQRKEERKANANTDSSLEGMIAYVDENGNITSMPPDIEKRKSINTADIVTGSRNTGETQSVRFRTGKVMFFNVDKGFGFIKDDQDGTSIYVSANMLLDGIKDNDRVEFETERNARGLHAIKVKLKK